MKRCGYRDGQLRPTERHALARMAREAMVDERCPDCGGALVVCEPVAGGFAAWACESCGFMVEFDARLW